MALHCDDRISTADDGIRTHDSDPVGESKRVDLDVELGFVDWKWMCRQLKEAGRDRGRLLNCAGVVGVYVGEASRRGAACRRELSRVKPNLII